MNSGLPQRLQLPRVRLNWRAMFVVVLLLLGVRALFSAPALSLVLDELSASLKLHFGLDLAVANLTTDADNARVQAGPIVLKGSDGNVILLVDLVSAEIEPLGLFQRRARVVDVRVVHPRVNLDVHNGRVKGIAVAATGAGQKPPDLRLDVVELDVVNAEVAIRVSDDDGTDVRAAFSDIDLRLREGAALNDDQRPSDDPLQAVNVHRLSLTVGAGLVEGQVMRTPFQSLVLDAFSGSVSVIGKGLLSPQRVALNDVKVEALGTTLSVAGHIDVEGIGVGAIPAFSLRVAGEGALAEFFKPFAVPVAVGGTVRARLAASSDIGGRGFVVRGDVESKGLMVEHARLGDVQTQIALNKAGVTLSDAQWRMGDTTVKGAAHVRFDDALTLDVDAEAKGFSIYALLAALNVDGAWADTFIDGKVHVEGTLLPFALQGQGAGDFTVVRVASREVRTVSAADLILKTAAPIHASDVSIDVDAESMTFRGHIDDGFTTADGSFMMYLDGVRGLSVDAVATRASFASVRQRIGALDFAGAGHAELHVAGPTSHIVLQAKAELDDFALDAFGFGRVAGDILLDRNVLTFSRLMASRGTDTTYRGDVVLDFNDWPKPEGEYVGRILPAPHLQVDLAFGPARAETLRNIIPTPSSGVLGFLRDDLLLVGPVAGEVHLHGTVGDGDFGHVTGGIHVDVLPSATLFDEAVVGPFDVALTEPDVVVAGPQLAYAAGHADVRLQVGRRDGGLSGHVVINSGDLAKVAVLDNTTAPVSGRFALALRWAGSTDDPRFEGGLTLNDVVVGGASLRSGQLDVAHAQRQLRLQGGLWDRRGHVDARIGTRRPFAYALTSSLTHGPVAALLPPQTLPATLQLDGAFEAAFDGQLTALRQSAGVIRISTMHLSKAPVVLDAPHPIVVRLADGTWSCDALDLTSPRGDELQARGQVSNKSVDVQLVGSGDLAAISALWPRVQKASGRYRFDVAVNGARDAMQPTGTVRLSEGAFDFGNAFPQAEHVSGELYVRPGSIAVDGVLLQLDSTPATLDGTVLLNELSPSTYDLALRVRRLPLSIPKDLPSIVSGTLRLTGEAALPTLSGDVRVHQARYTKDLNWERLLPDLKRRGTLADTRGDAAEDVRLDIHAFADRNITIENNVLDVEAKGDVFITGTDERVGLRGTLQLVSGTATFRNNRYRLERANIDFVDTYRIAPVLDIEALTRVQDYDITAKVTGPLSSPTVLLTSVPQLAEVDVLSLLTFGFTQYDVTNASGSAGAAGLEVVSAYTGLDAELERMLPDAVRKSHAVRIDELRLTSQFSMRAGASLPAVALGMQVNPGVGFLDGSRLRLQSTLVDTTGNGIERRVEWEKRFSNNVRLRFNWASEDDGTCPSCTTQWGDLGGDVWYRWEF